MILKKNLLIMLVTLTAVFLLSACKEEENEDELLPLSEALEEYTIWYGITRDGVKEESFTSRFFIFENDEVTSYYTDENLQDIVDLSVDELIEKSYNRIDYPDYHLDINLDESGENTEMLTLILEHHDAGPYEAAYFNFNFVEEDSIDPIEIFNTTFSGFYAGTTEISPDGSLGMRELFFGGLITQVDDSFSGFKLDSPDTDNEKVTIESGSKIVNP